MPRTVLFTRAIAEYGLAVRFHGNEIMKRRHPLIRTFLVLASLAAVSIAAEDPKAPPAANIQIQIQGQGQGQMQLGGVRIQATATGAEGIKFHLGQMQAPVIFLPGFPTVLLPNPIAQAEAKPGYLGVELDTSGDEAPDDADAKDNAVKKKNAGVGILNVVADSPAEKAGLKEGDHVLTLDGKEVKNSTQLREMIRALKPEQAVKMTVRRDGKEIELKAKLAAAPEAVAGAQVMRLNGNIVLGGMNAGGNEPQAVPGVVVFNRTTFIARSSTGAIGGNSNAAPRDKDSVSLCDGNRFLGKIHGIDPAKGLLLQRDGAPDLELIEEEITGLTFAERERSSTTPETKNTPAKPKVLLQLRDGSIFHGDALTMERGTLLLTLPGGQRIEIPREQAQFATLSAGESAQIYDGPVSLTGWTSGRYGQGQWEYRDGMLRCIANGPIGRDLGRMPDPLDMSFDVVFPRQMQHFGVVLFGTGVSESGVGSLSVQFSPIQIYGSQYDGKRSNQYNAAIEQRDRVNFSDKTETVHYRLLVDRVKGSALIYINGVKRADWKLSKVKPEDLGKCGATSRRTSRCRMPLFKSGASACCRGMASSPRATRRFPRPGPIRCSLATVR